MKPIINFWSQLGTSRRLGFSLGVVFILAATAAVGYFTLRDTYVPLVSRQAPERVASAARELARQKLAYRIADGGDTIEVPHASLGQARIALAGAGGGVGDSVGLEIFTQSDFSMTDFAQKVNYQRALQGELTRTIQAMEGVRAARVHVVLPDGGLLKRNTVKATAAVAVSMQDGRAPTGQQVRGIQRLVAASVPEISANAVTVLDESGVGLSRPRSDAEADYSNDQLAMKREVDTYLQNKLRQMLSELAPDSRIAASVDALLDFKQLRATVEMPLAVPKDDPTERATGVVVRERQTQRAVPGIPGKVGDAPGEDTGWDFEYKVGHRMEQSLSVPGSIKRLTVAVALHGAPANVDAANVEQLVGSAIGIDRSRGDVVTVVLLPAEAAPVRAVEPIETKPMAMATSTDVVAWPLTMWLAVALAFLGLAFVARFGMKRPVSTVEAQEATDVQAVTARVRKWLSEDK